MSGNVYRFPGIFAFGSSKDAAIRERWENRAPMAPVTILGEIVEYGIVSEDIEVAHKFPIRRSLLSEEKAMQHFDMETLAAMDFRVRWCRWYLDESGLPYDREDIFVDRNAEEGQPQWVYVSEAPDGMKDKECMDPLDYLLMWNFAFHGPGYAGRILTHFARADAIWRKSSLSTMDAVGLAREWMLIGETWAEARFVVNHSTAAVRGEKVAGGRRNSAHATNQRHVALRERRFARMRELVPSVGVENAARQCQAEGLGGWQGIRRQWDRQKQNPDT